MPGRVVALRFRSDSNRSMLTHPARGQVNDDIVRSASCEDLNKLEQSPNRGRQQHRFSGSLDRSAIPDPDDERFHQNVANASSDASSDDDAFREAATGAGEEGKLPAE